MKNAIVNPLWRILKDCAETMARVGARFGLTPSDRAGITIQTTEPRRYSANDPERILG